MSGGIGGPPITDLTNEFSLFLWSPPTEEMNCSTLKCERQDFFGKKQI